MTMTVCDFYTWSENIRGEGTWWTVGCRVHNEYGVDSRCDLFSDKDNSWLGRGAKQKAHTLLNALKVGSE